MIDICRWAPAVIGFSFMVGLPASAAHNAELACVRMIDESARVSRAQLQRLQVFPAGTRTTADAYCILPSEQMVTEEGGVVEVRRTFLPFEWDPANGLILLWQGDVYLGYDFRLVR
ncbi:MAG: hypothetical protein AAFQ63_20400 [Cyanobacteria bacterium J06621_11]